MIGIIATLAGLIVLAAFVVGWNIVLAGRRKGRFQVAARPAGQLAFWSDFGLFEFDLERGVVRIARDAGERIVPLASVATVRIVKDEVDADWLEEVLYGFDITDALGFRDQVAWHRVVVRLDTGEDIPVYAVGQLRRVELFATAAIEWLWDRLRKRGWIPDVAAEARVVLAKVAAQVRQAREVERARA